MRYCDIKTTKCDSVTDPTIWVKFISKDSNMLQLQYSLFNTPIIVSRYGFYFRSTDLANKTHL